MAAIMVRPDLKTAGGEVCDIVRNEEFIGTLTIVYRESERLSGSIQLEQQALTAAEKQEVFAFLQTYIQSLVNALQIQKCEVLVTCSDYELIIATGHALQAADSYRERTLVGHGDEELDYEWVKEESNFDDVDPDNSDEIDMNELGLGHLDYELIIVSEKRNKVEYHVYDQESELIAECFLSVQGTEVVGQVNWKYDPFEEEMDHVCDLIAADFNEDEIDSFVIHMYYNGEAIDTIELTHVDLLEESDGEWAFEGKEADRDDYTIVLARDDGDTLTYEIYKQSYGGLPIGTATVDISERQLTGFIDFREPGNSDDRELIATLLLDELDKEKDYETINLSMLYRNKLIDEILFETEQVH